MGHGTLNVRGLPPIKITLLVGLKANLISICQLCDQDMIILFTKNEVNIWNDEQKMINLGRKSVDKCYMVSMSDTAKKSSFKMTCPFLNIVWDKLCLL